MEMDIIVIIMCFELMLGVTVSALQIIYIYILYALLHYIISIVIMHLCPVCPEMTQCC